MLSLTEELANRGIELDEVGKYRDEVEQFSVVLEGSPSATVDCRRGMASFKLDELDAAEADYIRAIELEPNYARAYFDLGVLLAKRGELNSALEQFNTAIRIRRKARMYFQYYPVTSPTLSAQRIPRDR